MIEYVYVCIYVYIYISVAGHEKTYISVSILAQAILAQAILKPGAGHGFAPWPPSVVIA